MPEDKGITAEEQLAKFEEEYAYLKLAAVYEKAVIDFKADPTPEKKANKRDLARQVTDARYRIRTRGRRVPTVAAPAPAPEPRKRSFLDALLGRS